MHWVNQRHVACKRIQDSLGFRIPWGGFRIQVLDSKKKSAGVETPREISNEVIQLFSEGKERVGVQCKSILGLKDKGL